MAATVKLAGKLAGNLKALERRIAPRVEKGMRAAALVFYDQSQTMVPVDTEALKLSGEVRQEGTGLKSVFIIGYGNINFRLAGPDKKGVMQDKWPWEYAAFVHFGHGSYAPHMFLTDAVSIYKKAAASILCASL